jgi:hypothetical protein
MIDESKTLTDVMNELNDSVIQFKLHQKNMYLNQIEDFKKQGITIKEDVNVDINSYMCNIRYAYNLYKSEYDKQNTFLYKLNKWWVGGNRNKP